MVKASIIAFAFVCIFMILYYKLLGFVSWFALLLQISVQLLALSIPQITLTLPGIAGIILSIGMGVDANVIISERIREELRDGATLGSAIDIGYHKAFSAVFDGNITSIATSIILMIFGTGSILSFAYTLMVGCILNFVSGVTASRIITKSMSMNKQVQKKIRFMVIRRQYNDKIYEKENIFAISITIMLLGIISMFVNGVNLSIQFKGGAILKYSFKGDLNIEEAKNFASEILNRNTEVQVTEDLATGN